MSAREPERAEDPVAALVDGMLRRRRVVRGRRAAARAIVAAMAVAWLYAIVEFFQGGPAAAILVFGRVALHAGPLAVAFFALRSPRVGPQLFGRVVLFGQIWWTLFLGVPSVPGLLIGGASIAALVLLGSDRLEADDGPFRPIFFRGALVACILLAGSLGLQAAQLLFESIAIFGLHFTSPVLWKVVYVAGLLVAAIGLYRLATLALLFPLAVGAVRLPDSITAVMHDGSMPTRHFWFFLVANVALIVSVLPVVWGLIRIRREVRARWVDETKT